jgi:hypothetical protein
MAHLRQFTFFPLLLVLASCSYFKKKNAQPDADVVARVKEEYLYVSDVSALTRGLHGKDSIDAVRNYAESWVRKKLLLQKAQENISDQDVSIAKKIEDYRQALLLYEYEKELIEQKLDTAIKADELNIWYEKVKADFTQNEDVLRILYIKLPKDAPDLKDARKWITKPKDEEEERKLEGYCRDIALTYSIDKGLWYNKETALNNFPVSEADLNSLATSKTYKEFKQGDALWFIKVSEKIAKGEPSPLELIRSKIAMMVLENRKMLLLEKTYNKIYEEAKESESFNIYVK